MKLKKVISGLFLLGLGFSPFVFSDYINYNAIYEFDIGEPTQVGNYIYQFDHYGNLSTDNGSLAGNFVFTQNTAYNVTYTYGYGWINGQLYGYGHSSYGNGNTRQGFINNFCQSDNIISCLEHDFPYDLDFVKSNIGNIVNVYFTLTPTAGNFPVALCFYDGVYYYCSEFDVSNGGASDPINSLGLSLNTFQDFVNYNWSRSPFTSTTPTIPNVDVGICPTVKTLLSTSNLTPAVCYAGYDSDLIYEAGENTPIQFGSGITIFETYDLFSGDMTIQNWYDTYWNYYQSINWNAYPFYGKPKALLGLQTARQIAGTSAGYKGSYVILNYCWYLLGNFDENASTCVLPKLDSVYSGITITNQDKQDLIDDLNDDYDIRRPGSGSIYDGVWSGNGGGSHSRGEECNSIPCMFNKFYDMFNTAVVDDVDFTSSGLGILPSYIGLAFVVVVLFYIFKR